MRLFLVLLVLLGAGQAFAGSLPSEKLKNPVLEAQAEDLFSKLRCLVCQNESIADSNARIAQDLRLMVRTHLKRGESEKEILDFIHSRYGDFVLLKPPLRESTLLLWFGPFLVLLAGLAVVGGILRQQRKVKP